MSLIKQVGEVLNKAASLPARTVFGLRQNAMSKRGFLKTEPAMGGLMGREINCSTQKEYRLPLEDVPEGYIARVKIGQPKDVRRVPKSQVATFGIPTAAEQAAEWNQYLAEMTKRKYWNRMKGLDNGLRHDDIMYFEAGDEVVTEALKRCDPDERMQRTWRAIQAAQLSHLKLIADHMYSPNEDVHYLEPWVNQVDKEFQEAEYWDRY